VRKIKNSNMKKVFSFFIFALFVAALMPIQASAALELVKSKDFGTVYYIDSKNVRHPFPNEATYKSWYGNDFSKIVTVDNNFLSQYPLGNNITIRPGTSPDAAKANYFDLTHAIVDNRSYHVRDRAITSLSKNVFDPSAMSISDRRDCENKKLKAAIILVTKDRFNNDELSKVQLI
jgi:hypothetical protein